MLVTESSYGQVYKDYLGAGQNVGVSVSSSTPSNSDTSLYTISGTTNMPDLAGASRFLSQATLGANYEEIELVSSIGINAWFDAQFALPVHSFMERYDEIYAAAQLLVTNDVHSNQYTSFTFYDFVFKDPDFLRQKVAFALSQIFVISKDGVLSLKPDATMTYYDILYQGAFGNYRDMLGDITYSTAMTQYLSHFQNQREDVIGKTLPDENFAREVMQLFSIGLDKLNIDGTPIKDESGQRIPTYDIEDVAEMAKIFTGLGGKLDDDGSANDNFLDNTIDLRSGTKMFEDYHAIGDKQIFDDIIIQESDSGIDEIEEALDALFNHENVGPFLGLRLIQQMVKSNPTPSYVKRVAMVFNDNGAGVRGDMKAVIKAILLDPEARNCDWIEHAENGKLIQPIERFITLFKAFDVYSLSDTLWLFDGEDYGPKLLQAFIKSPTVFNFYSPYYAEEKFIAPLKLMSPEFEILNEITSIEYINEMEDALKIKPFSNRTNPAFGGASLGNNADDEPILDISDEITIYNQNGLSSLLDRLDILICRGQLSQEVRDIIINTINANILNLPNYDVNDIINDVLYYIFLSPDYIIQK